MSGYESYVEAHREREARRAEDQERRRARVLRDVERAARVLRERYGADEVYVFGSVAYRDRDFRSSSEVDLAVTGLPLESFFEAWREAEQVVGRKLDLVDLGTAGEGITRVIREYGRKVGAK
jgi:predicted nucleotidyltransferase